MPGATSYQSRRGRPQARVFDPDDLSRRLSIVANQERLKELERRRSNWEASLLHARHEQPHHDHDRSSKAAPLEDEDGDDGDDDDTRRVSQALSPTQLPAPALDRPPRQPARNKSLPFELRPQGEYVAQYAAASMLSTTTPRIPSVEVDTERLERERESALDLETIEEVAHGGKDTLPSKRTLADRQRKRSSMSLSERQARSHRHSSLAAEQGQHSRQDWSQSDETARKPRRRSSIMEKMGQYWKIQSSDGTSVADREVFHSDASTLRNSWRSSKGSLTAPTLRRRSSILKRDDGYWIVSPLPQDEVTRVDEIHSQGDESTVEASKAQKLSSFFSKLKI